ncbi:uncharacterized protein LOC105286394 [Ooceraea biroi]|nr:uncharacterized protein LOC105286394 [Ooceraea biroi]
MPRFALLPSLSDTFNTTLAYMTKKLELLEESCKQITEHLKEVVNELLLNKKKNKKPVTSENSVSTDNKPEDLNQIIPKPDHELIVNQKPVAVKDDKKGKPIKQGDKEDIPALIKNENTIAPSSNENTVSTIVPTNQAETTIKENGQTEKPETLHESEKLETISSSEEKPQSEVSKPDESEKENAQEGDNKETMEEKDS